MAPSSLRIILGERAGQYGQGERRERETQSRGQMRRGVERQRGAEETD